jgi:hypothetical protein
MEAVMWKKVPVIVVVMVCLLTACNQSGASEATALIPTSAAPTNTVAPPDSTEEPPSPTENPVTETPVPPTDAPSSPTPMAPTVTPTDEPAVAVQEVIASQPEDIIGTWDSLQEFEMIYSQSGGARIINREAGEEMVGVGAYHFDGDQLVLVSEVCLKWEGGFAIEFACTGTYTPYVVKEGDEVTGVRFEVIEDPYLDRRKAMTGHTWQRVEE